MESIAQLLCEHLSGQSPFWRLALTSRLCNFRPIPFLQSGPIGLNQFKLRPLRDALFQ